MKEIFKIKSKHSILLAFIGLAGFLPQSKAALFLGSAASFAVLGGSAVTSTGNTVLTGDLGVSPGTAITGFYPSGTVSGTTYAGGSIAVTAQTDVLAAYNALTGEVVLKNWTDQNLGGLSLTAGVRNFTSSAQLSGILILDAQGDPNARFDFLIGSTLTTVGSSSVLLVNGAQANNVYWQVGSSATLGSSTAFNGNILAFTSITLNTGASLTGRALAMNGAVTLDNNIISIPTVIPEAVAFWPLVLCASIFGAWQWLAVWRRKVGLPEKA